MSHRMAKQPTYYEILNVSSEASALGIVKAYREIKEIYQPGSLATYSLYSEEELAKINERIEEAYLVLSNPEARRVYDEQINLASSSQPDKVKTRSSQRIHVKSCKPGVEKQALPEYVDGKVLRQLRESQGITLDDIAKKTNIPKLYLQAIEVDDASAFPGHFYFKSYLQQYAECIGLDPQQTWEAYQVHVKD